jgi:hypothetical protein
MYAVGERRMMVKHFKNPAAFQTARRKSNRLEIRSMREAHDTVGIDDQTRKVNKHDTPRDFASVLRFFYNRDVTKAIPVSR